MADVTTPHRRSPKSHNMMKNMFRESDDESSSSDDEDDEEDGDPRDKEGLSAVPPHADNDDTMAYTGLCHDFQVVLRQDRKKGIAHQLWPAATFLSHYLEQHVETLLPPGTSVLELGAGIGLCGLVCYKLHATSVVLTDLPVAMSLLDTNVLLNAVEPGEQIPSTKQRVRPMVLSWGNESELAAVLATMDKSSQWVCVAADCVYWEALFEPFFHTVRALVVDHHVDVILAHVKRWKKDERFFKMCRKHMQVIQLVEDVSLELQEHTQDHHRVIKRIYRLTAKV
ncbi:hypothetical protein DYB35_000622 [Aphanomyces astaci]|uniref:FAM86 N-terminal domain-containing protein n=1 Tax=Aphanomyces astaci TaxID=112090 RepID=A0A418DUQ0_APHAT|nr:hypothetical protein DYB35_000622 [Aphanomyces astaci]